MRSEGCVHVLGLDTRMDLRTGRKLRRGIFPQDRTHIAVFGFPGTGKSTFLLSLIKQNIDRDEGFMVMDPHGDLARKVLTHIPKDKWDRVVYIDPLTAFEEKYGRRVVQINFLECKRDFDRELVARFFMDSLEKLYTRYWGPRLDMILMNAVYLLLEEENPTLPDLYDVVADDTFRDALLLRTRDNRVKSFWQHEFKRMPREASSAVLTKIYRLVQERLILPMFSSPRSSVDFRRLMDQGKFVIVNLPEGLLSSDVTNFLGSLILARVYLAGMSREDTPEEERAPFYVYLDEAYRFVTASVKDILQSLRKFRVYMTLAAQYLGQYRKDVQLAIPHLCDTIVCFSVGKETAKALLEFFPQDCKPENLMQLPKHKFYVSALVEGQRRCQVLECIDYALGPSNPDDVINVSLSAYGRYVNVERVRPRGKSVEEGGGLPYPEVTPAMWAVLLTLREAGEADQDELIEQVQRKYFFRRVQIANAIRALAFNGMITVKEREKMWLSEKTLPYGLKVKEQRKIKGKYYAINRERVERLLNIQPRGVRAGGPEHNFLMGRCVRSMWMNGWFCLIDTGDRPGQQLPDIIVYPLKEVQDTDGTIYDAENWDVQHRFAIEIETDPADHKDRIMANWKKCAARGLPVMFIVKDEKAKTVVEETLKMHNVQIVDNILKFKPAPGLASVAAMSTRAEGVEEEKEEDVAEVIGRAGASKTGMRARRGYAERRRKIASFADWSMRVKRVGGKAYLYADKSIGGKTVSRSLGPLDEEALTIIEELRLTVKGLNFKVKEVNDCGGRRLA